MSLKKCGETAVVCLNCDAADFNGEDTPDQFCFVPLEKGTQLSPVVGVSVQGRQGRPLIRRAVASRCDGDDASFVDADDSQREYIGFDGGLCKDGQS